MIEALTAFFVSKVAVYAGGTSAAFVLAWIMKKIPNDKIKVFVGEFFYKLGVLLTLGLTKWKYTKGFWNSVIEPWFIDLLDNVIGEAVKQFIKGLRSDNK